MRVVWTLALNTFREAVRDRVLHSIFFFAVVTVCASLILKDVTLGDQDKVVRSIAEGGIDVFASLIAMFLGISIIWKELEKKTVFTILSKPMPRWQFVLGKYLGLNLTIWVEIVLFVWYVRPFNALSAGLSQYDILCIDGAIDHGIDAFNSMGYTVLYILSSDYCICVHHFHLHDWSFGR